MMIDLSHVHAFTDAMQRKDRDAMLSHMTDDIVLKTPLATAPFIGKDAIRPVVTALLGVVDTFDFREILQGPDHVAAFFGLRVGPHQLDGVDVWRLDGLGLIREMTVLWRPLPAAVAVEKALAQTT
jgi:hypothetical protein